MCMNTVDILYYVYIHIIKYVAQSYMVNRVGQYVKCVKGLMCIYLRILQLYYWVPRVVAFFIKASPS